MTRGTLSDAWPIVAGQRCGRADVWDSGKVDSAAQTDVEYGGPPLQSDATYFWAVRVWTDDGPGGWSLPARFETGFLSPSQVEAQPEQASGADHRAASCHHDCSDSVCRAGANVWEIDVRCAAY